MRIFLVLFALFSIATPSKAMALDLLNPIKDMFFNSDEKTSEKPTEKTDTIAVEKTNNETAKEAEEKAHIEAANNTKKTEVPITDDKVPSFAPKVSIPEFKAKESTENEASTSEEAPNAFSFTPNTDDGATPVVIKLSDKKRTGNDLLDFNLQSFLKSNNVILGELNPAISNIGKNDKITIQVLTYNNYPATGEDIEPTASTEASENTVPQDNSYSNRQGLASNRNPSSRRTSSRRGASTEENTPNNEVKELPPAPTKVNYNKNIITHYDDKATGNNQCYYKIRISNNTPSNLTNLRFSTYWEDLSIDVLNDDFFINYLNAGETQDIKVFYKRKDCSFSALKMNRIELKSCDFTMDDLSEVDFSKYPPEQENLSLCSNIISPKEYSAVATPDSTGVGEIKVRIDKAFQAATNAKDVIAKKRSDIIKQLNEQKASSEKLISEIKKDSDDFINTINKNEADIKAEQNKLRIEMEEKLRKMKEEQEEKLLKEKEAAEQKKQKEDKKASEQKNDEETSTREITKDGNTIKLHDKANPNASE